MHLILDAVTLRVPEARQLIHTSNLPYTTTRSKHAYCIPVELYVQYTFAFIIALYWTNENLLK